jgi:carbamoyltransferase
MYILGISSFYHDSAVCLIRDGDIIYASQEERFTRIKHDPSFPKNAIIDCLNRFNLKLSSIDHIVFYEKPFIKFDRLIETYLAFAPKGFKSFLRFLTIWAKEKLFQKDLIINNLNEIEFDAEKKLSSKIFFSSHHMSHASSAFFPSPFFKAAILTMDAVGEWATSSVAIGEDNKIQMIKEIRFPHSLGLLYSSFTYFLGFKVNSGEYKVMGLAPYGTPKYVEKIKKNLVKINKDGSFFLNMNYFEYPTGLKMVNKKFEALFGRSSREPEMELTQDDMDIAASIQKITEEMVINIAINIANQTKQDNLCLAGGVALNCVVNGILVKKNIFKNIWIQPAAGDAGGSLGSALALYYMGFNKQRIIDKKDSMKGSYLGPVYSSNECLKSLKDIGANVKEHNENEFIDIVVQSIIEGKIVGWMNGNLEFGPRALGARSIIADPRSDMMQKNLNLMVKYRESFRPFAPSILFEDLSEWFDLETSSPYMLLVSKIREDKRINMSEEEDNLFGIDKLNIARSTIPAVTHLDYSARIQTVHQETNPKYHALLKRFKEITGCPILINTSFNIRGEPIVCSPSDAYKCFCGTGIDLLAMENLIAFKEDQPKHLLEDYRNNFKLD